MENLNRPGRPQDKSLDKKITEAAWHLLSDRPLAKLTINEIATQAETSRPAIYRRWNSVEEIVIDAFLEIVKDDVPQAVATDPADALREYIPSLVRFLGSRVGQVMAEILGRAQSDPLLMEKFREGFLLPRRRHGREMVLRGQSEGVFRKELDCEMVIDLYAGPIYFRAFARHAPLDEKFARELAEQVISAIQTNPIKTSAAEEK